MAKKSDRPRELELLGEKVREAKELIGQLRESNRALAAELTELKSRLGDTKSASGKREAKAAGAAGSRREPKAAQSAQLELLRRERKQIRQKISHLLEKLEGESNPPSAG
jgi:hypothetical protein